MRSIPRGIYDATANSWSGGHPLLLAVGDVLATSVNGQFYVLGGWYSITGGSSFESTENQVYIAPAIYYVMIKK